MKIGPYHLTISKQPVRLREFGTVVTSSGASIQHLGDLLLQLEAYLGVEALVGAAPVEQMSAAISGVRSAAF